MGRKRGDTPILSTISTAAWKTAFARKLLGWYTRHRRDLPWRRFVDPYRTWVSEVMLQQTQVATVTPYFLRFMAAFPTIRALAEAEEQEVLKHWEGLGYYRRARQMHRTARVLEERHGGEFPRDLAAIGELPGIGRYTAGAIVSIAFDLPAPILEANTVRLFSRLTGLADDPATTASRQFLWQFAEAILPGRNYREFNQALMELGSLICTPKGPQCDRCPVSELCTAYRTSTQNQIPRPRPKPRSEAVREAAVVVRRSNKVLLRKRTAAERWGGMWDFVRFPLVARRGPAMRQEILDKVREHAGLAIGRPERIATLKHGVTRFRITLDCYTAEASERRVKLAEGTWRWVRPAELPNFPLSVTGRKLGKLLIEPAADLDLE